MRAAGKAMRRWWWALILVLLLGVLSWPLFGPRPIVKAQALAAAALAQPKLPFDPNANAPTQSIADAINNHTHPERLASLIAPKKFDPAAFAANPAGYLSVAEPGRVWDVAKAAAGVHRLSFLVKSSFQIPAHARAVLAVKAAAGMPVTFTSFDGGAFDNLLTTQTVLADATGKAAIGWTATEGTMARVNILAASPQCTGRLRFMLDVEPP